MHKGRTTRTPWDPVLVEKTIATTPASQAIPRLIVAGIPGPKPALRQYPLGKDSNPHGTSLKQKGEAQLDQAGRGGAHDLPESGFRMGDIADDRKRPKKLSVV